MTIAQFLCGLFRHKPHFHEMVKNGVWIYQCRRCGYKASGHWFYMRNEINKNKPL